MALALGLAVTVSGQAADVDVKLPAYKKVSGVSGTLNSVGSDTLNNMTVSYTHLTLPTSDLV